MEEQSGYYLALSFATNAGAEITTELINGTGGVKKISDGFCVYRITDKDSQIIRVSAKKNERTVMKEYSLSQLVLGDWLLDSSKEKILDDKSDPIRASDLIKPD